MKPNKGNKKKNTAGLVSLILWAVMLTLLFKSCSSSLSSANEVQVDYSIFRQWVMEDLVESVHMESGKYVITIKEGPDDYYVKQAEAYLPEEDLEGGMDLPWLVNQEQEKEYVTTPVTVTDVEIISLMTDHGVDYYTDPVDPSSYILSMVLSYLLPVIIMVGAMMFLYRGIGGKGGMGGIGGVGKANAKVYMEKKTGVTFRDVPVRTRPRSP